jgi:hypothetical protein
VIDTSALSSLLSGYNSQVPTAPAPVTPTPSTNPLDKIAGLFNGGTDLGSLVQKIGMGMSNMGPTGGDPYLAFAQGFGGTAKYTTAQQAAAAAQKQKDIENAIAANKMAMDQGQFDARMNQDQSQFSQRMGQDQSQFDARQTQDQSQSDRDYALKQAADKRQQMLADQEMKKSAAEIERMARGNGLTVDQQIQIERIAQAAGENIIDPAERKKAVDEERDRMTEQFKAGATTSINNGPGVTAQDQQPITATGPNGERLVLQNGQWVPLQ